jgi:hypothetical protein
MTRVLIVANETAGGPHLSEEIHRRAADGPLHITLLVPATRPHGSFTWTDGQARVQAKRRMDEAIGSWSDAGVEVEGVVGVAPTPFDCVTDILRDQAFDDIVVSTLPHAISRWLRMDLPHRIERLTQRHVTHVVAPAREHSAA